MIPPFFTSVSSIGCTSTRSPSGLTLTDAIGSFSTPLFAWVVAGSSSGVLELPPTNSLLFLLVFVNYFKLCIDHVAIAATSLGALFGTPTRLRFRAWLWSGLRARSGGIQVSGGGGYAPAGMTGQPDAVRRLQEAKQMLDGKLITDAEYEAIKAKIVSS